MKPGIVGCARLIRRWLPQARCTDTHKALMSEIAQLRKELGFLIDADNFYRKLKILIDVMSWLRSG
ncbi:hypothetical protein [Pseudomonas sp. KK18]|uniref:hypothetical protein n=1 Tax=Pseudomonas sp. KK18 TaxID=3123039 RepID=UPI0030CA67FE